MKLYLALNEGGTNGDIAVHTKLAVLSAIQNTKLKPHLLYSGRSNALTRWLEDRGVVIVKSQLPYLHVIQELENCGRYTTKSTGHWLRTNICLEEWEDSHVLYTDIDILFLKDPQLSKIRPRYFAAAPEFDPHSWNYFNAGVMVANPAGLRRNYWEFEKYLTKNIVEHTYGFHDQIAYNEFYRGRWDRLPLELNWKPYWGSNSDAVLLHFHGPKFQAIQAIINDEWDWSTGHGKQIGSLFVNFVDAYLECFELVKTYLPLLAPQEQDQLSHLFEAAEKYDRQRRASDINLEFMNFKMFAENA